MASILDVSVSSDSEDDVDYVPAAERDSSFDEEDVSDDEDFNSGEVLDKKNKGVRNAEDKEPEIKSDSVSEVDEKKRANDLWLSFLSDVESVTPKKSVQSAECNGAQKTDINSDKASKTPEIGTEAGETISKADDVISTESVDKKDSTSCNSVNENSACVSVPPTEKSPGMPKKRGIDSVLGKIMNKNKKLSVLDQTAIDWRSFKKDEDIESELERFNKGKLGFIERQRFLERSDVRSFEVEKSMRHALRKK